MPAAEFWVSFPRVPLFQVCGTKRKHGQEACMQQPLPTEQEDSLAKRMCLDSSVLMHNPPHQQHIPVSEVNQNHMQDAYTFTSHQDMMEGMQEEEVRSEQPSNLPILTQPQESTFNTISTQQVETNHQCQTVSAQQVPSQQDTNIMDLCGETFSNTSPTNPSIHSVDSMAAYMESDFVPDAQQYSSRENACSSPDRIHCHRPSWEGFMDMKPYISDIY